MVQELRYYECKAKTYDGIELIATLAISFILINPINAGYGYETKYVNNKGYLTVEYLQDVYYENSNDGSTVFPIFFKLDMFDNWTGPWYNRILYNPDDVVIDIYVDHKGYSDEITLTDLIYIWPASNSHNGLSLSASAGSDSLGLSVDIPSLTSYGHNYDTGSYSSGWLKLGSAYWDFAQYNFYGDAFLDDVIKLYINNDEARDHPYSDLEFKLVFKTRWQAGADLSVNPWVRITYQFIIGDDIPSNTDVNLDLVEGTVEANF